MADDWERANEENWELDSERMRMRRVLLSAPQLHEFCSSFPVRLSFVLLSMSVRSLYPHREQRQVRWRNPADACRLAEGCWLDRGKLVLRFDSQSADGQEIHAGGNPLVILALQAVYRDLLPGDVAGVLQVNFQCLPKLILRTKHAVSHPQWHRLPG